MTKRRIRYKFNLDVFYKNKQKNSAFSLDNRPCLYLAGYRKVKATSKKNAGIRKDRNANLNILVNLKSVFSFTSSSFFAFPVTKTTDLPAGTAMVANTRRTKTNGPHTSGSATAN